MAQRPTHDIVIVGGGSAGISTASSLLKRRPSLDIAIVEPSENHYYQPGWTMVGGGVFNAPVTCRPTATLMPKGVRWIRQKAASFQPERAPPTLDDGHRSTHQLLIAAPGIRRAGGRDHGPDKTRDN